MTGRKKFSALRVGMTPERQAGAAAKAAPMAPTAVDLQRGFEEICTEGQGVWNMEIIPRDQWLELIALALCGDHPARQILAAGAMMMDENRLCLLCDVVFSTADPPCALVVVRAATETPSQGIFNAVCDACATRHQGSALKAAVLNRYRELVISDLREISISDQTGTA